MLGPAEACTGDPARRLGNEFVFQMLAQQNIETLNEAGRRRRAAGRRSSRPARTASTPSAASTRSSAANYEVIHHTQLLARLVEDGKLTPVNPVDEKITYHDPCFLGRHNKVYTPPRRDHRRRPRHPAPRKCTAARATGFCCGAGGARMWLEERTGKRINDERIDEALALDPDTISTACPYCMVMLGDAVNAKKAAGQAKETLEVIDVAQLLVRSIRLREDAAGGAAPEAERPLNGHCSPREPGLSRTGHQRSAGTACGVPFVLASASDLHRRL